MFVGDQFLKKTVDYLCLTFDIKAVTNGTIVGSWIVLKQNDSLFLRHLQSSRLILINLELNGSFQMKLLLICTEIRKRLILVKVRDLNLE